MTPYHLEITEKKQWSEALFSLRLSRPDTFTYQAGQFVSLFCEAQPKPKAYSLVSHPDDPYLEIFFNRVPNGAFSNLLADQTEGAGLSMIPKAAGLLTLEEIQPAPTLWLIATGTGLGPYLSLLKDAAIWTQFDRIICIHGIRTSAEICYEGLLEKLHAEHSEQFQLHYAISREPINGSKPDQFFANHSGRIPSLLRHWQASSDRGINAEDQVVLCGNPEMIKALQLDLEELGMARHRHRMPGQIHSEIYQ